MDRKCQINKVNQNLVIVKIVDNNLVNNNLDKVVNQNLVMVRKKVKEKEKVNALIVDKTLQQTGGNRADEGQGRPHLIAG